MKSFASLLSLLGLLSATRILALPYSMANGPVNMTIVPRDDVVKCNPLSLDDAQKKYAVLYLFMSMQYSDVHSVPGWDKLEQYAKDTWGDGSWNIVTNPTDYLDRPANACVDDSTTYTITPKGSPQCTHSSVNLRGHSETNGANGTAAVSVATGQSTQGTWTVSQSSSFSIGTSFSVGFGIEGLFDASTSITTEATMENTSGKSFSTTTDTTGTTTVTAPTESGKDCGVSLDVESCNQQGEGRIRIAASGYVWFNYDDARPPKDDPEGDKHYKYAASIDDVLSLDERSSWMSFTGAVKGTSNGRYKEYCK